MDPLRPDDIREFTPVELLGPLNDVEERNAPRALFARGDVRLVQGTARVAIVGSREASADGLKRAARLARILAERQIVVVSGLAEGIDTAAHTAAIQHKGRTVAVIGTPLDQYYPRQNSALQERIASEHLLISQFPVGAPVERKNFVLRNRTMALAAHASVIVEARDGGGSLSQAWEALRLGRPLFLMKSLLERKDITWPDELMQHGANVLEEADQLLEALPDPQAWSLRDVPF
jgi:DNA processing protein